MNIRKLLTKIWFAFGFGIWSFAVAAQDMPGGPKVNQLNSQPPQPKLWKRFIGCIGS